MANPRKSQKLKILGGTDRPDRATDEPEYELTQGAEPPDWLTGPHALEEWRRLVTLLEAQQVLTGADTTMLAHLCNVHGSVTGLWQKGMIPPSTLLTQLRLLYSAFGLTPADRAKVSRSSEDQSDDEYSEFSR